MMSALDPITCALSQDEFAVGTDLDNTVALYDSVFERLSSSVPNIPEIARRSKHALSNYLRDQGREAEWTVLQGIAYGPGMADAAVAPGFLEVAEKLIRSNVKIAIISHRSRKPDSGDDYDLHAAARAWVQGSLWQRLNAGPEQISLHIAEDLEAKIDVICASQVHIFVDDLPKVLGHPRFPAGVEKILYSSSAVASLPAGVRQMRTWSDFHNILVIPRQ